MTFGSLFCGAGGFDVALERVGMKCLWQCEIDRQCRSVLARHWPDVLRIDNVVRLRAMIEHETSVRIVRPALLCGGFPCQDLSVAGRRAGLAGSRSGMWWVFRRIIGLLRPGWILIENVPGLLSSNGGRDFGTVLGSLAKLGYGFAYRILDAQWFRVPQRRRRVFIVGCLGDWRRAAEVLFESESLPWDSPPSREARARVAASLTRGPAKGSGVNEPGRRCEDDVNIVPFNWREDDVSEKPATPPLSTLDDVAIAYQCHGSNVGEMGTMRAGNGNETGGVPFTLAIRGRGDSYQLETRQDGTSNAILTPNGGRGGIGVGAVAGPAMGVRRLMPIECERLQGFPDDWTRYGADGEEMSDSVRYRMMGNAVAVPCVEWIGRRLMEVAQ